MSRLPEFQRYWPAISIPGIRDTDDTYTDGSFDALPSLPSIAPGLEWLMPLDPLVTEEMRSYWPNAKSEERYAIHREKVFEDARRLQIELPSSLRLVMGSVELQHRFPSFTACYFDLPDRIMPSPFRDGDWMLRFLNDQQGCICWYVYFPSGAAPFIVCSGGVGNTAFLEKCPFEDNPGLVAEATKNTAFVAPDFDAFAYRYWIENTLRFNLLVGLPLSTAQLDYARGMQADFKPPAP